MFFEEFERKKEESSSQKTIYHSLCMLASLKEVEVSFQDGIDKKDYLEGEAQFYQYIKELYFDMYDNNEKYKVDSLQYDAYMRSKQQRDESEFMTEKQHDKDAKASSLKNLFQQSVTFYFKFLYELGNTAQLCIDTFSLKITEDGYKNVLKNAQTAKVRKDAVQRVKILQDTGITKQEGEEGYVFSCQKYPKMFLGLLVLCRAPESKYKWMNYLRLDYRRYHIIKPDILDIEETVSKQTAEKINMLIKTLSNFPLKLRVRPLKNITSDNKWKIEYTYQRKNCIGFQLDCDFFLVSIYFNDAKNITALADYFKETNPDLFTWYRNHISERLCTCPNNTWVTLGDTRRRICGRSNRLDVKEPNEYDLNNCVLVLRKFRNIKQSFCSKGDIELYY